MQLIPIYKSPPFPKHNQHQPYIKAADSISAFIWNNVEIKTQKKVPSAGNSSNSSSSSRRPKSTLLLSVISQRFKRHTETFSLPLLLIFDGPKILYQTQVYRKLKEGAGYYFLTKTSYAGAATIQYNYNNYNVEIICGKHKSKQMFRYTNCGFYNTFQAITCVMTDLI